MVLAAKQDNPIKRRPRHSLSGIALPRVDGRTVAARRFRELVDAFSAELGANLTETERGMVRQAAALQLRIEQMQGAIVESPDIDADLIIRLSSEHRRLLTKLRGKAAKNKPAVATIADYVARKVAEKAASAPDGDAA